MAVNITLVIMRETNNISESVNIESGRWRKGEFVNVYADIPGSPGNDNPRFYNIFISGCPGTFDEVKEFLISLHEDDVTGDLLAKSCHRMDFDLLTNGQRNTLFNQNRLNVSWNTLMKTTDLTIDPTSAVLTRSQSCRPSSPTDP